MADQESRKVITHDESGDVLSNSTVTCLADQVYSTVSEYLGSITLVGAACASDFLTSIPKTDAASNVQARNLERSSITVLLTEEAIHQPAAPSRYRGPCSRSLLHQSDQSRCAELQKPQSVDVAHRGGSVCPDSLSQSLGRIRACPICF